jgi:rhodanese-related sulfurtransferase
MKVDELKKKIDEGEDLIILDIREADEVAATADPIPGAKNVPMGKVFTEAAKGNLSKEEKIIAVCRTGGRCEIVAHELNQKGFDIEVLEGGFEAWKQ